MKQFSIFSKRGLDQFFGVTMNDFKELMGKTVSKIRVDVGGGAIVFHTEDGMFVYDAEGDCCSTTWFHEINDADALLGSPILSIEDREIADEETKYGDLIQTYGARFTTAKGYSDISYRNRSNGYYGGNAILTRREVPDPHPSFIEVTSDWQCGEPNEP